MSRGDRTRDPGGASGRDPLAEIRAIVLDGLRGIDCRVFLFGSRARGDVHDASDVDVAVLPRQILPLGTLSRIREALEDSTLPFTVDLVDLSDVDPGFRTRVEREGVTWID